MVWQDHRVCQGWSLRLALRVEAQRTLRSWVRFASPEAWLAVAGQAQHEADLATRPRVEEARQAVEEWLRDAEQPRA